MGLRLAVDGVIGPQTRSATRSFQQRQGLKVDGVVGKQTEQALSTASQTRPPATTQTPGGAPAPTGQSAAINTPLPESGPGFRAYQRNQGRRYGLPETISALIAIAAAWQRAHPQGPRIETGDISFQGGGRMPPHKSHNRGVDIDIHLMRNDGREGGTTFRASSYSRTLTQELVNLIRANGLLIVKLIFFNDPAVTGVTDQAGHDNHLHVRFCVPGDTSCRPQMQREMSWAGETMTESELNPASVNYMVDPAQPYGPKWKARRPPGLPAAARQSGRAGSALPYIEQIAQSLLPGDVFVKTLKGLSQTESGARFALPANIFDARPKEQRPVGKPFITAWGAFQFNAGAWRALSGVSSTAVPWDATPFEELSRPINRYAQLFSEVLQAGGDNPAAARGVRLWHRTPAGYRQYVKNGRCCGFASAWQQVPAEHRTITDRLLRQAGILI
jgi:murein endopeptidase